ncbi:pyridoxal phosphate-dependent aminotransferase family protein [Aquimarina sp. RZ0]|uniref:aminotransferase class I/II-fold pyridoxal phosphate-dependent enzyme n=1 Tax=Aquimarina sp. RZ0 TaxID=2607730 RepID=UPI0011F295DF|nr:pyridoxal phosphate-dependent aminotransferase family protein [Aquimarina sp. RZ0]KAA1245296.1 pyridoxal phosphate-dependent aminotransferase family protein [Aquimarina sp. RZ0]
MDRLPKKLQKKLQNRESINALRTLCGQSNHIDFSSNDYLGFASSKTIFQKTHHFLEQKELYQNGATGSRLLSGNHELYTEVEIMLATFHNAAAALVFNSGYDANIGFFSSVPQRGDIILYDEYIHASIRDGIQMSHAKSYKFAHNQLEAIEKKIQSLRSDSSSDQEVYIVTESVFSMDGDTPDLRLFVSFCNKNNYHLIVDEAHATGVFGNKGVGLLQQLELEDEVFARINTFGKALGCHGAVILGSEQLKSYLVNFARSFIYTTGLPPHSVASILVMYKELETTLATKKLKENIDFFNREVEKINLNSLFIKSNSAIHCCILSGNKRVKKVATKIQQKGFDVKPILSPTVPEGQERLRFCLHSYNSKEEISQVLNLLITFI